LRVIVRLVGMTNVSASSKPRHAAGGWSGPERPSSVHVDRPSQTVSIPLHTCPPEIGVARIAFFNMKRSVVPSTVPSAVLRLVDGVEGLAAGLGEQGRRWLAAALAVLHSLVTTQAAPTNFRQRNAVGDEAALAQIFNRFERWQALRAVLQVLNFGILLWALVGLTSAR